MVVLRGSSDQRCVKEFVVLKPNARTTVVGSADDCAYSTQAGKGLQWVLWKGIEQFLERESRRAFWWAQSTCRKGVWWE